MDGDREVWDRVHVLSPDERRRDEVERLRAELAVWGQRKQRAEAELGPPRLRNRNKFFNGLLHGDLNTLERADALRREIQLSDENIVRIRNRLARLGIGVDAQPRQEEPRGDLDRRAASAKVSRAKKARRSADQLLAAIRKARKRIGRAGRHRAGDDASRAVVDQDAKEVARLFDDVRRLVAKLKARAPSALSVNLDGAVRFSGSGVDDRTRAKEYKDATLTLDALARAVAPIQEQLVFREAEAKRVRKASSR